MRSRFASFLLLSLLGSLLLGSRSAQGECGDYVVLAGSPLDRLLQEARAQGAVIEAEQLALLRKQLHHSQRRSEDSLRMLRGATVSVRATALFGSLSPIGVTTSRPMPPPCDGPACGERSNPMQLPLTLSVESTLRIPVAVLMPALPAASGRGSKWQVPNSSGIPCRTISRVDRPPAAISL